MLEVLLTKELEKVAKRLIWFKTPKEALEDPYTFMAHVMMYGTLEDILIVKSSLGMKAFQETLDHLPPGIIDSKSWVYWNIMLERYPVPSLPKRKFNV